MALTIFNFEKSASITIVDKGRKYYTNNRVTITDTSPSGVWEGKVRGTETYDLSARITPDGTVSTIFCNCPYDYGSTCKHKIAFLLKIKERVPEWRGTASATAQEQKGGFLKKIINNLLPDSEKKSAAIKPKDMTPESLYADFKALNADDNNVVRLAAMIYEPFSQTKFAEVFNAFFTYGGKQLNNNNVKTVLADLQTKGFIVYEQNWRCNTSFADFLCFKEAINNRAYLSLIPGIQSRMEISPWYNHGIDVGLRYFRDLRFAFFYNNVDAFNSAFGNTLRMGSDKYTVTTLTEYFIGKKVDPSVYATYPQEILTFLIFQKVGIDAAELKPQGEFFTYLLEILPKSKGENKDLYLSYLSFFSFLRGNWRDLDTIKKLSENLELGVATGTQYLLKGMTKEALESFALSTKELRRTTRNPKAALGGWGGAMHLFAQFKAQDPTLYPKITTHLKSVTKTYSQASLTFNALEALLMFLQNNKKSALTTLNQLGNNYQKSALNIVFIAIITYLIDEKKVDPAGVKQYYNLADKNGYKWLAAELKLMLHRLQPNEKAWEDAPDILKELGITPLLDLFPRVEEWENALGALLGMFQGTKAGSDKENDSRLIWLVNFETRNRWASPLQPREQVYGKSGWSSGRAVALLRLKNGEVGSMTEQDKRIARHIYGYSGNDAYIDFEAAIPDLVGHPYLFLEKSPTVAVQLMEDKLALTVKSDDKGYNVQFSHAFDAAGSVVIKESPTRYKLIKVTDEHVRIAQMFNGKVLSIPKQGETKLKEVLASLSKKMTVQSALEDENLPKIDADPRVCVHLLPVGDGFHVELYAKPFGETPPYFKIGKGETGVIAEVNKERVQAIRNLKLEKKNADALLEKSEILRGVKPAAGVWELTDAEMCLELLYELQPLIDEKDIVLEWPKGEKFRISKVAGFEQFNMSINSKSDWFEVNGELRVDENTVLDMKTLLTLSEKKDGQFVELSPGKFLALTNEFRRRLQAINGLMNVQKNGSLQLHPLASPALNEFTDLVKNLDIDKKFKQSQERLKKAFKTKFTVPETLNAELRPYQREGYEWLSRLAMWGVGAVLADDMGLGKTVQGLALLLDRADLGPTLVVAPASVCRNWVAETEKFAPSLTPLLFGEGDRAAMVESAKAGDVVITTYDLMTRESEQFTKKKFGTIILDEAQAIKNRATKRSETAMQLQGEFKIAMSGTPLENHLGELWNLFQFANPGLLGSVEKFQEKFSTPIEKYGDAGRRDQLRRLVQPFILRRRKDEVLKDLPAKTEIQLTVELSKEERAFYEALRRRALESLQNTEGVGEGERHLKILAELMRLRRAACHPRLVDENADFIESSKLKLFGEVVEELLENGHKALVFSQFVGHLQILENYLKEKQVKYQYLDGQTPLKKRQERIEAFQKGEGDFFLISLKAGGTGLNLTAADFVIHMDPWWNPAVEDQATDRAHRIGQEKPVTVYRLVTENTIEEKILKLHEQKRDLADSLLEGTDAGVKMNAEELLALIRDK